MSLLAQQYTDRARYFLFFGHFALAFPGPPILLQTDAWRGDLVAAAAALLCNKVLVWTFIHSSIVAIGFAALPGVYFVL